MSRNSLSPAMLSITALAIAAGFGACQMGNPQSGRTAGEFGSASAGDRDFYNAYSGWAFGLEQDGDDNVLLLQQLPYTERSGAVLLERLAKTLPSLRKQIKGGTLGDTATVAASDEQNAYSFVENALSSVPKRSAEDVGTVDPVLQKALERLDGVPAAEQAQTIIEYLANVPQKDDQRRELRARFLYLLGQSSRSTEVTLQILNQVVRGVNLSRKGKRSAAYEVNIANHAIRAIVLARKQGYVAPGQASSHRMGESVRELEQKLRSAKVRGIKALGEGKGVNDSLVVTMRYGDGATETFLYKPALGSKAFADKYYDKNPDDFLNFINFTRESRAANFMHFVLDEMAEKERGFEKIFVPETFEVALYSAGTSFGMGSLQRFVSSDFVDIMKHQRENRQAWVQDIGKNREWRDIVVTIKVLDYMFGNIDRLIVPGIKDDYDKNLMVNLFPPSEGVGWRVGGVALIDNGLGLPGRDWYTVDKLVAGGNFPGVLRDALRTKAGSLPELLKQEHNYFVSWGLKDFDQRFRNAVNRSANQ